MLFESKNTQLNSLGPSAIDSVLTVSDECTVLVPVQNYQTCAVDLPGDLGLGVVEPFDECDPLSSVPPSTCASVQVDGPGYYSKERPQKVLSLLDFVDSDSTTEQLGTLKAVISQHADLFELDGSELGHTDVIQHMINTGDSAPIKQHPYRTPVVQREKIAQLIRRE